MLTQLELLIVAGLVIVLLVLSVLDFALAGVNKIALRRITEATPERKNALKAALVDSRPEVLMAIHISIQTTLIAIAVLLTDVFRRYTVNYEVALPAAAGATVVLVLTFRQIIPRAIALANPAAVLGRLVSVLGIPYFLLRPLVRLIMALLNRFKWESVEPEGDDDASDDEIQAFIDAGQEEGILEQDEGEMIHSIVQFGDKLALEVMTPRPQIIAAELSSGVQHMIDLVVEHRHSRLPVYRGELDNVEGIIHARDLLRLLRDSDEGSEGLRALLRPALFVPETKPVDDLLEEMRLESKHLALVVDEYGGISGLITIEDLVEEIVGEIDDDPAAGNAEVIDEGHDSFLIPGSTELDMVASRLGRSLFPDTECTTLGGAVVELFGRLPVSGECIAHDDMSIEVVGADRRKVQSVRIRVAVRKSDS